MLYEIGWRLSEEQVYADYTGPVKGSVGPDGKPRNPKKSSNPEEEQEDHFSMK
jgi:hypothetical protein